MLPGVIDSQQPSNNNGEGEDDGVNGIGDSSQRSEGSDQITLQTVVTSVAINPEREGSVHSNFAKYRSSPITFEDYFSKSRIQRRFISKVLKFQVYLNSGAVCSSFLSTIISDQVWFWNAKDDLLNALLLHTVILSTMMLLIPFLTYKLRKWTPGLVSKSVLEALVRVYQASLFTFWFAFGCGKIWRSQANNDLAFKDSNLPLFYLPFTYYGLSSSTQLLILIIIRFTQTKICNRSAAFISIAVSGGFLILTLPLVLTGTIGRGFLVWETLQIIGAAFFSGVDSSTSMDPEGEAFDDT